MSTPHEDLSTGELRKIRDALGRVTTLDGVVDNSPISLLIASIIDDHEELESRIDAVCLLIRAWQEGAETRPSDEVLEEVGRLLRGGRRVPETTEDL